MSGIQTYLPLRFIVTIALSENLRHFKRWIYIYVPDKKLAMFEKKNEWIEAEYLIFERINGKVLSD